MRKFGLFLALGLAGALVSKSSGGQFIYTAGGYTDFYYETVGGLDANFWDASQNGGVGFFEVFTGKEIIPARDNYFYKTAYAANAHVTFWWDVYWLPSSMTDIFPGNPTLDALVEDSLSVSAACSAGDNPNYHIEATTAVGSMVKPGPLDRYGAIIQSQQSYPQSVVDGTNGWKQLPFGENIREAVIAMVPVGDGTWHGRVSAVTNPLTARYYLYLPNLEDTMPSSAWSVVKTRITITSLTGPGG